MQTLDRVLYLRGRKKVSAETEQRKGLAAGEAFSLGALPLVYGTCTLTTVLAVVLPLVPVIVAV